MTTTVVKIGPWSLVLGAWSVLGPGPSAARSRTGSGTSVEGSSRVERKVRPDGTVKVLDFGLAKAPAGPPAAFAEAPASKEGGHYMDGRGVRLQPDMSLSPTITSPAMTQAGLFFDELRRRVP